MKNTYLKNFGFVKCGCGCWYNKKTDHFIAKDDTNGRYYLSYLFGADLGDYPSFKAIEDFLSGKRAKELEQQIKNNPVKL